jgi:hypothetical protein
MAITRTLLTTLLVLTTVLPATFSQTLDPKQLGLVKKILAKHATHSYAEFLP